MREATDIGDSMKPIISTIAIGLQITIIVAQEGSRARPRATVLVVEQDDVFHIRECGIWRVRARAVEPHVALLAFLEHIERCFIRLNHYLLE